VADHGELGQLPDLRVGQCVADQFRADPTRVSRGDQQAWPRGP
jgi:hypothetical protein